MPYTAGSTRFSAFVDHVDLPDLAPRRLDLGATLIAGALAATASWRVTGSTSAAWACLAVGVGLGAWALEWGWRITAIAVTLCIVPPGVIGENSAMVAVAAAVVLCGSVVSAPIE